MIALLVVALNLGQVAGVCGPGKACTVQSLTALKGVRTAQPNASFPACTAGVEGLMLYDTNGHLLRWCDSGNWLIAAGAPASTYPVTWSYGFKAALAYASFPACDSTKDGALIWDTTNHILRACNNFAGVWQVVGTYAGRLKLQQTTYYPGLAAGVPFGVFNNWLPNFTAAPLGFSVSLAAATLTAGTGAGNLVLSFYDAKTATDVITLTVPCAAAAGTKTAWSSGGFVPPNETDELDLRVKTDGCTTRPTLNVSVQFASVAS